MFITFRYYYEYYNCYSYVNEYYYEIASQRTYATIAVDYPKPKTTRKIMLFAQEDALLPARRSRSQRPKAFSIRSS